ncbi:MAG: ribosomal subunit interface protein [Gammaproteobacteria bacterium HGW-Gammaproteobacteria-6]|nr:MAG: ribosomal subunit interface protein [Gammaproteobacteria bacterium HGW-Gammaproteobacteria-6]
MQVQVNSKHIQGSTRLHEWVTAAVTDQLDHYDDYLTRIEIHISDDNAHKGGADDKRCQIEMRPKGHQALSVKHKAESLEQAVNGAASKARHALEHLMGRLETRPNSTPLPLDEAPVAEADALLQEDFLARQAALGKS